MLICTTLNLLLQKNELLLYYRNQLISTSPQAYSFVDPLMSPSLYITRIQVDGCQRLSHPAETLSYQSTVSRSCASGTKRSCFRHYNVDWSWRSRQLAAVSRCLSVAAPMNIKRTSNQSGIFHWFLNSTCCQFARVITWQSGELYLMTIDESHCWSTADRWRTVQRGNLAVTIIEH